MKLDVRTYDENVRRNVIRSIERIVKAECDAGRAKEPRIESTISSPATVNDDDMVERFKGTFGNYFKENMVEPEPATASEDFTLLATAVGAPYVMWTFGGVDEKKWD